MWTPRHPGEDWSMASRPLTAVAVAAPFGRDVEAGLRADRAATLDDARERGAGLVVFPETTLGGYVREPVGGERAPDLPPSLASTGRRSRG